MSFDFLADKTEVTGILFLSLFFIDDSKSSVQVWSVPG